MDSNRESNLQGKKYVSRLGIFALAICIFGLSAVPAALAETKPPAAVFLVPAGPQHQLISEVSGENNGAKVGIAYPSSTHICLDGCQAHENWIEFYLVSNSYVTRSLRLRTSLFLAQIFTVGIGSRHCSHQDRPGYTCIDMEISHRLLRVLTGSNLTPLEEVRDIKNWWLEYTPAG